MNYCSKPSHNYRDRSTEEKILPRLFTPTKERRASEWLRSGRYDEKLAVLKSLWIKEEERQATDKVLKETFHPGVAPRVRVWLDEAKEEERKAIMKLFRTIATQPSTKTPAKPSMVPRKANPQTLDLSGHFPQMSSDATKAKPSMIPRKANPQTLDLSGHFPQMSSDATKAKPSMIPRKANPQTLDLLAHYPKMTSEAPKAHFSAQAKSRKVHWDGTPQVFSRPPDVHGNGHVAQVRTEFDIAPDWRAPKRTVVPMTQVTRRVVQEGLPRLTKHACLHPRREFVIHPEWIMH